MCCKALLHLALQLKAICDACLHSALHVLLTAKTVERVAFLVKLPTTNTQSTDPLAAHATNHGIRRSPRKVGGGSSTARRVLVPAHAAIGTARHESAGVDPWSPPRQKKPFGDYSVDGLGGRPALDLSSAKPARNVFEFESIAPQTDFRSSDGRRRRGGYCAPELT